MNKLYILCGIPFSGKTTLAKELEKRLGFARIDLDEVKFELLGQNVKDEDIKESQWNKIYLEMYQKIEEALKEGKTVVHDTGNFTRNERGMVKNIADKLGVESITIFVYIPIPEARKRILGNRETNHRFDVTDKDFESTVNEMEPPTNGENFIVYDSSQSLEDWLKQNF